MTPIVVARNNKEKVKIEPAVNSCRVSVKIKQLDEMTSVLVDRYARFLMLRAEQFKILRRRPVEGYDISFLITKGHMETYLRDELVEFIVSFISTIDAQVSKLKLDVNNRARKVADEILSRFK